MADNNSGGASKFNAALQQMMRIHALQERVNTANLNLRIKDNDLGVYYYEIKLQSLNSLYLEVYPKCSEEEQRDSNAMMNLLLEFKKNRPIHKIVKRPMGNAREVINEDNYQLLVQGLILWEKQVRRLLEEHKMNSPNMEEYDEY